jgi:hypothetical protein
MAIKVGDLYVQMEMRGDVDQDVGKVENRLQQVDRTAGKVRDSLQRIDMPDKATQGARKLQGEVDKVTSSAGKATEKLGNMTQGMGNKLASAGGDGGTSFGGAFLSGAAPKLASLGSKAGPIGMAVAGVAAIGIGAGAVLAKAIGDGMQIEKQTDKIQAQLGTNPETMKVIGKAAADSYTGAFGESVAGQMTAAKDAIQSGLLTGEETANTMTPVINKLTTVSDLLGEDIPRVSRSAAQMIKTGMAKDASGAMDILVKASQRGLNVSEDLLDTVDEYSTQFRKLGLEGPEAMGLLQQSVKAGARDTDTAADAIKEFSIRAVDGSKASAEGYSALGLSAEDMTNKIAKGGQGAKDGLNEVLMKLRAMPEGAERTAAAVALFGTKAEDLGDALFAMDLGKAKKEFGDVAGAADEAIRVIGDNGASKLESARRQIEVSMDGVKVSLAQAFGPALEKVAEWVSTHKPEIIAFFTGLTDATLATAQGIVSFVSGSLRMFASFMDGTRMMVGDTITQLGWMSEKVGGIIKHIPGLQGTGEAMEGVGEAMKGFNDKLSNGSDTLRNFADNLDTGNEKLGDVRDSLKKTGADAAASAEITRALGDEIEAVPGEKTITISDTTPEAIQRLEALNLKTRTLDDGTVEVYADTEEGQATIDGFITANTGREVPIDVYPTIQAARKARGVSDDFIGPIDMTVSPQADGGIHEPGQARIANGTINQWAEAGPEAFIPLSQAKRRQSELILGGVAKRFGMALIRQQADGGIFDGESAIAKAKAHDGEPYVYGGLDCSGYLSEVFNSGTGQSVRFTTDSDFEGMGWVAGDDPNGFTIGTNKGSGENGHMSGRLYGTPIESDGSNGIQYGGGADDPTTFPYVYHWPGAGGGNMTDDDIAAGLDAGLEKGSKRLRDRDRKRSSDAGRKSSSGGVQDVRVTNWPDGLGKEVEDKAKARLGVALYANGGTVGGAGTRDTEPALLTPGEEVTPRNMAIKHRALLKAIARDQVGAYAEGGTVGFGGYTTAGAKYKRKMGLADYTALAAGVGFMGASGFDDSGKFKGFDTSSTGIPGLEAALSRLTEIANKTTVVIEHAEINTDDPMELVNDLTKLDPAGMAITQRGM